MPDIITEQAAPPARRCVPFGELDRRTILGASEIAPVLGMSRFWTPLAIYLAKKRSDAQLIDKHAPGATGPQRWGNRLERAILDSYREDVLEPEDPSLDLRYGGTDVGTVLHPEHPWMAASPDGVVVRFDGVQETWLRGVECKNVDRSQAWRWGEPGTDDVPDEYALQCHWSMHVTGLDRWDLAALIGGNDFRVYTLHRDDELLEEVLRRVSDFWTNHVEANVPPEASAPDNALLSRLMRQDSDELIVGDAHLDALVAELALARTAATRAVETADTLEARIKQCIGTRAGAEGPWGRILWKQNKPSKVVDWRFLAEEYLATLAPQQAAERITLHSTERPGARPFRVLLAEENV